ncbi:MAG: hypothetical protein IJO32_01795 [Bacilli bacterium]|nr:hypothetical protein [Bacilli bacterium]
MNNINENEKFTEYLSHLCKNIDSVIEKDIYKEYAIKQKLYALSSFIEFLKAGASLDVLPIENEKVTFIINIE